MVNVGLKKLNKFLIIISYTSLKKIRENFTKKLVKKSFTSFPVEMQPLISDMKPRLSNLNKIIRVRGSITCSMVALSALSLTRYLRKRKIQKLFQA